MKNNQFKTSEALVLSESSKGVGWITLNRPKALNALNIEMIETITNILRKWQNDSIVHVVVIQGKGRAFCAGGDLRQIYQVLQKQDEKLTFYFFNYAYDLNRIIHNYSKPYIAILNGITMGGGMGLSMHGSYRIVTDNALLAMPETGIGFFPDVGASYFLNKCPGSVGLYLGLTGMTIGPADALYSGLATHYFSHNDLLSFLKNIVKLDTCEAINEWLNQQPVKLPLQKGFLSDNIEIIEACFNKLTLLDIFQALENYSHPFAKQTLSCLKSRSPVALKATFNLLKTTQNFNFHDALIKELNLSQEMVKEPDFIEGIRAAIIDKDRNPKWISSI